VRLQIDNVFPEKGAGRPKKGCSGRPRTIAIQANDFSHTYTAFTWSSDDTY
jgi:hypothetical protein